MSTIKNQRCFTEATASARLILATGLLIMLCEHLSNEEVDSLVQLFERRTV